jgi:hypothetical protein
MKHLNEIELVDFVEQRLPASRARHLDDCEPCRKKADELRQALSRVAEIEAPEPSPLFWDHFSTRVRDAVNRAEADASTRWPWPMGLRAHGVGWSVAGAVLVALLVAGVWRFGQPANPAAPPDPLSIASTAEPPHVPDELAAIESDPAWALVRSVADDLEWDDAATAELGTRPGWAERAVLHLTLELNENERREFVRLLQEETKRPGA